MRRPPALLVLVALLIFLGASGLFGGTAFLAAPDGHLIGAPRVWLDQIPFASFLVPGLLLFLVIGVLPLAIAAALIWRPLPARRIGGLYWGWTAIGLAGFGIIVFQLVELTMIAPSFLHAIYVATGAAIVALALTRGVRGYYRAA